jgi:putative oxidoreductase
VERSGRGGPSYSGGGILLLVGLYSRQVALAMVPILLGSIFFAHIDAGWLFSNEGGGWEFPAFWTATLLVQALLGDGAFALSSRLRRSTSTSH